MKWVATALVMLLMGCGGMTIKIDPVPQKKQVHKNHTQHHARSSSARQRATPPPQKQKNEPNIKETWWIENYHKLQAAHGNYSISDDAKIEPLPDGRFRVPDTVLSHYQDMLLAKPTPKP